jgi:hypothetical protein
MQIYLANSSWKRMATTSTELCWVDSSDFMNEIKMRIGGDNLFYPVVDHGGSRVAGKLVMAFPSRSWAAFSICMIRML